LPSRYHVPGLRVELFADEPPVVTVGYEADVLALGRVGDGEIVLLGDLAHLRLVVLP